MKNIKYKTQTQDKQVNTLHNSIHNFLSILLSSLSFSFISDANKGGYIFIMIHHYLLNDLRILHRYKMIKH